MSNNAAANSFGHRPRDTEKAARGEGSIILIRLCVSLKFFHRVLYIFICYVILKFHKDFKELYREIDL